MPTLEARKANPWSGGGIREISQTEGVTNEIVDGRGEKGDEGSWGVGRVRI